MIRKVNVVKQNSIEIGLGEDYKSLPFRNKRSGL